MLRVIIECYCSSRSEGNRGSRGEEAERLWKMRNIYEALSG